VVGSRGCSQGCQQRSLVWRVVVDSWRSGVNKWGREETLVIFFRPTHRSACWSSMIFLLTSSRCLRLRSSLICVCHPRPLNGCDPVVPLPTFSPWGFKGACREAPLFVDTMGHFVVCDFQCWQRWEMSINCYDWKTK
jgi:hypothetical protein